jgi:hypothetical protein
VEPLTALTATYCRIPGVGENGNDVSLAPTVASRTLHDNDDVPMQTSYDDTPPDAGPGSHIALTVCACANVEERVSSEQARITSRRLTHGALHHTSSIQLLRKRTAIAQQRRSACAISSSAIQFRRQSVLDPYNAYGGFTHSLFTEAPAAISQNRFEMMVSIVMTRINPSP